MRKHKYTILALGLLLLVVGCNWPLDEPALQPGRSTTLPVSPLATATEPSTTEPDSPESEATEGPAAATPTPVVLLRRGGLFAGRTVRFDLPEGYRVLEGDDGGCFIYPGSRPGFLVLYPMEGEAGETVTHLLNGTADVRRTETPLEVELGGLTFTGIFVENGTGNRLFLAATEGWGLVVQGPVDGWPSLAGELNQVLVSLSFEEEAR